MWYQNEIAGSKPDRPPALKKKIIGERNCCARFQCTFGEIQREVGSQKRLDEILKEDDSRGGSMRLMLVLVAEGG